MTTSSSPPPPDGPGGPAGPGDPDGDGSGGGDGRRRLQPVSPGLLTGWVVAGLVVGWLLRRLARAAGTSVPEVSWTQVLLLALVAAILGVTAVITRREVTTARPDLLPHRAVNRLVLARACALVGALLLGGYAGHALSWVGSPSYVAEERMARALLAALAGASVLVAALLLERACRVRSDPDAA